MSEPYQPDGFTRVTPFLTVTGVKNLMDFLTKVFDAEVIDRTEKTDGTLAYAALRIGDGNVELAEANERFGPMISAVHIYVPNVDQTHQRAIENGGVQIHEPMEMDYGERGSAIRDPQGNHWYIATYHRE